jgi:predicted transcriptional regulator
VRRSPEQITENILRICKEPTGKTAIVYQCNLNFHTVNIHLQQLINAGLLNSSGSEDHPSYRTTPKGIEALEHINVLRDLLIPIASSHDRLVVLKVRKIKSSRVNKS